ncbi:MAG: hypothetical protein V1696_01090 [Candidatus Jorgensenbacteria bacterium]
MWRFIKKWWVLQHLRKEIAFHTGQQPIEKLSSGGKILPTQDFFIKGTDAYPGLAKKSVKRFSWILWWRKKENMEKLKKRIHEYNEIFEVCVKESYIEMQQMDIGLIMPSTATPLADSIHGWWGLLQNVLKKYNLAWTVIVIPILLGAFGSPYLKAVLTKLW